MKSAWLAVVVSASVLPGTAGAQDLQRYREYVLGSSVESVVNASGAAAGDVRTLHERPALIQRLLWRAPYVTSPDLSADPVRDVAFSFYDDQLHQIIVSYDRVRTEGLTSADLVAALSQEYGTAVLAGPATRRDVPDEAFPGSVVAARWQNAEVLLTLLQSEATPEFQLILVSTRLGAEARRAIREAGRLDVLEGPRRQREEREQQAIDAAAAREKAREINKAAFRP